ncbi:MAG: bifunctional DNA-formamidopyrimidine glycosylase/DNA-(apurinic or apyrimidinic site) lyase [Gammaproteobacteria bacterium]|nr:bifunctional DNA-formamidopyrimidine glycosylase/DNA-(apurinic or apyrimidinic site) lyase [Gammaproteobacteria bacterium]MDH5800323.1 bifunctional DNA-formamidopyrimidine glycosylase/DNA-(apurinic or apyrimidinic site) lyase [Gammaproteobacteria bacterium]
MPELPEVETTLRGIEPYVLQQRVKKVIVRQPQLRWPIPDELNKQLQNRIINKISRRGKYILLHTQRGAAILHLGMSGSLRVVDALTPAQKHDHVDICFTQGHCLRLRDPRRFGALLWSETPEQHPLLSPLGVEPLSAQFDASYLHAQAHGRKRAVKLFLMDSHIVVGVGNIYANEALFAAGIHPKTAAGKISLKRYETLASAIQSILTAAIQQGGTTLKDFLGSDGKPGYFKQQLNVYDRADAPCPRCTSAIKLVKLGQRSTYFCSKCQR